MDGKSLNDLERLEDEISSWSTYHRGLSPGDRECLDELFDMAREVVKTTELPDSPLPSFSMFLAILVKLAKRIRELEARLEKP